MVVAVFVTGGLDQAAAGAITRARTLPAVSPRDDTEEPEQPFPDPRACCGQPPTSGAVLPHPWRTIAGGRVAGPARARESSGAGEAAGLPGDGCSAYRCSEALAWSRHRRRVVDRRVAPRTGTAAIGPGLPRRSGEDARGSAFDPRPSR